MKITDELVDEHVLEELGARARNQRIAARLTQAELAKEAGVSRPTITSIEEGRTTAQIGSWIRVLRALGLLHRLEHVLTPAEPGPMERLKGKKPQPQRVRKPQKPRVRKPFQWGDDK